MSVLCAPIVYNTAKRADNECNSVRRSDLLRLERRVYGAPDVSPVIELYVVEFIEDTPYIIINESE